MSALELAYCVRPPSCSGGHLFPPRFPVFFVSDLGVFSYLTTRLEVLSLGIDTLVVVDVVLPAVLCLVLVGEAGVEACNTGFGQLKSFPIVLWHCYG